MCQTWFDIWPGSQYRGSHITVKRGSDILWSDHSPIIATVDAHVLPRVPPPALTTQHTDWEKFRSYINAHITLNLRLKERRELDDAIHQFTTLLQNAAWHSTPPSRAPAAPSSGTPLHIRDLVAENADPAADGNARVTRVTERSITA